jgi:hypothetical protein
MLSRIKKMKKEAAIKISLCGLGGGCLPQPEGAPLRMFFLEFQIRV